MATRISLFVLYDTIAIILFDLDFQFRINIKKIEPRLGINHKKRENIFRLITFYVSYVFIVLNIKNCGILEIQLNL
jgi:hypothetical protein